MNRITPDAERKIKWYAARQYGPRIIHRMLGGRVSLSTVVRKVAELRKDVKN